MLKGLSMPGFRLQWWRICLLSLVALTIGAGVILPGSLYEAQAHAQVKLVTAGPVPPRALVPSGTGVWLWQNPIQQGNKLNGVTCAPDGLAVCYAVGDYGTVVRSSDYGATWQALVLPTSYNLKGVSCFDSSVCVAVGMAGTIMVSSAPGTNWRPVESTTATDLNAVSCVAGTPVCFAVGNSGKVFKTVDQGNTWNALAFPYGDPLSAVSCFKVINYKCLVGGGRVSGDPSGPSNRLVSTPDGGASWVNETPGLGSSQRVNDITCFNEGSNRPCYAVGAFGAIAYTPNLADSGSSWNLQSLPAGFSSYGLGAVTCAASSTRCYLATAAIPNQLFSNSGGSGWAAVATGLTLPDHLNDLSCSYSSGPATTRCLVVGDFGRIIATTDSGASWTDRTGGILNGWVNDLSCPNLTTCFAAGSIQNASVTSGLVLGTTDRGNTWNDLTPVSGPFDSNLSAISCINSSPVICVAVGTRYTSGPDTLTGRIYLTTNGGASWSSQSVATGPLVDVSCVDGSPTFSCLIVGGSVITGGYAGDSHTVIYRTADSAVTWDAQNPPVGFEDALRGVSCVSATTCFATGGSYTGGRLSVIGSTDGVKWNNKLNRTGFPSSIFNGITCLNASICYVVGGPVNSSTSGGRVEVTNDGGVNWQVLSIPTSPPLNAVSCVSNLSCFAAGQGGTILTTNEGGPWTNMPSSTTNNLYAMSCTVVICITAGAGGGILESPLLVTNSEDTDSLTVPGTLSYALNNASGYQSIYGYAPDNKVGLSGSNPLPHLQSGVRFVGGSCSARLIVDFDKNKTGLVLEGRNWITGLELINSIGPGITTAGTGNHLSCIVVRI